MAYSNRQLVKHKSSGRVTTDKLVNFFLSNGEEFILLHCPALRDDLLNLTFRKVKVTPIPKLCEISTKAHIRL